MESCVRVCVCLCVSVCTYVYIYNVWVFVAFVVCACSLRLFSGVIKVNVYNLARERKRLMVDGRIGRFGQIVPDLVVRAFHRKYDTATIRHHRKVVNIALEAINVIVYVAPRYKIYEL